MVRRTTNIHVANSGEFGVSLAEPVASLTGLIAESDTRTTRSSWKHSLELVESLFQWLYAVLHPTLLFDWSVDYGRDRSFTLPCMPPLFIVHPH